MERYGLKSMLTGFCEVRDCPDLTARRCPVPGNTECADTQVGSLHPTYITGPSGPYFPKHPFLKGV